MWNISILNYGRNEKRSRMEITKKHGRTNIGVSVPQGRGNFSNFKR